MDSARVRARDDAARRLRRLTAVLVGGAGALALVAGSIAARAFPGRSSHPATRAVARSAARRPVVQSPPALVAVGSGREPATPAAPAPSSSAPAPTSAPPAVVSGGS